jgi:hypothetical protein
LPGADSAAALSGAGVGAQQREVAGVPRPHPVVDLAAELADRRRRGVDQADVAELAVGEALVLAAAVEGGDLAAQRRPRLLALVDDLLARAVDRLGPRAVVGRRVGGRLDLRRDVVDALEHPHAEVLARQLLRALAGDEARPSGSRARRCCWPGSPRRRSDDWWR